MSNRGGPRSPVPIDASDRSPTTRYRSTFGSNGSDTVYPAPLSPAKGSVITPPTSGHTSATTTGSDGGMQNAMGLQKHSNGSISPPSSVGRSSDGAGLYKGSRSGSVDSRKAYLMEEALSEHYVVLKRYLSPHLREEKDTPRQNRARDKLVRLSAVQFQELSTDVFDELLRREDERQKGGPGAPANDTPRHLLPKPNFHYKRNQARQKLSTLPIDRFRQLATDVFYELERRSPKLASAGMQRGDGPAINVASTNRGPSSRTGTPNGVGVPGYHASATRGVPTPYRTVPTNGYSNPGHAVPGSGVSSSNDFGRPLPKTFQSNTIIPNKSTLVEDDDDPSGMDDDDDDTQSDAFGLESAARRSSKRTTGKSLAGQQDKLVTEYRTQVAQLEAKVDGLETQLRDKNEETDKLRAVQNEKEIVTQSFQAERAQWSDLRRNLEQQLQSARDLNKSLQSALDKLRSDNTATERDLRAQLDSALRDSISSDDWRQRYENLELQFTQQQQVTDEVRREATLFLQEMRHLSARSSAAVEKEDRLAAQVAQLNADLQTWKSRYARTKAQLRTLRASSVGLMPQLQSPDAGLYARDADVTSPEGLVRDVHVTRFQLSIDELLQTARTAEPAAVLDCMKSVVLCVRDITSDIDAGLGHGATAAASASSSVDTYSPRTSASSAVLSVDAAKVQGKLKARVSATANNLITASKNHVAAAGLSPVSLLDAAASHLTTAVVGLIKAVKVRPTPVGELEDQDEEEEEDGDLKPAPLGLNVWKSRSDSEMQNGLASARRGSGSSAGYSGTSSPERGKLWGGRRSEMQSVRESEEGMEDLRNYLEDQTAHLVQAIQPLVHTIRATPADAFTAEDERAVAEHVDSIDRTVQAIAARTNAAVETLGNAALKKHAPPVVEALQEFRVGLVEARREVRERGRAGMPPLAFKIARATKELVLRVERVEGGQLTVSDTVTAEF